MIHLSWLPTFLNQKIFSALSITTLTWCRWSGRIDVFRSFGSPGTARWRIFMSSTFCHCANFAGSLGGLCFRGVARLEFRTDDDTFLMVILSDFFSIIEEHLCSSGNRWLVRKWVAKKTSSGNKYILWTKWLMTKWASFIYIPIKNPKARFVTSMDSTSLDWIKGRWDINCGRGEGWTIMAIWGYMFRTELPVAFTSNREEVKDIARWQSAVSTNLGKIHGEGGERTRCHGVVTQSRYYLPLWISLWAFFQEEFGYNTIKYHRKPSLDAQWHPQNDFASISGPLQRRSVSSTVNAQD